jgi:hypothetical protein
LAVGRVPDGAISGLSDGRLNWIRTREQLAALARINAARRPKLEDVV